jgi:hypothetical protein
MKKQPERAGQGGGQKKRANIFYYQDVSPFFLLVRNENRTRTAWGREILSSSVPGLQSLFESSEDAPQFKIYHVALRIILTNQISSQPR